MVQLCAALSVPILDSNSCTALTDLLIDLQNLPCESRHFPLILPRTFPCQQRIQSPKVSSTWQYSLPERKRRTRHNTVGSSRWQRESLHPRERKKRKSERKKERERKSRSRTNSWRNETRRARKREIIGLPFHRHPDRPRSPVPQLPGRTTLTFFPLNRDSIGAHRASPDEEKKKKKGGREDQTQCTRWPLASLFLLRLLLWRGHFYRPRSFIQVYTYVWWKHRELRAAVRNEIMHLG